MIYAQPKPTKQDKKMKKLKKLGTKSLTNKLDQALRDLFKAQVVRGERKLKCFICGLETGYYSPKDNPHGLQIGHFASRSVFSLRWDLKNCEFSCSRCNYNHEYNILPFTVAMLKAYGQKRIDYLNAQYEAYKKTGKTMNIGQKTELLETLEALQG